MKVGFGEKVGTSCEELANNGTVGWVPQKSRQYFPRLADDLTSKPGRVKIR
jgi:hypothetical protein